MLMVNLILRNMCSVKIGTAFSIFWVSAKNTSEFGLSLDIYLPHVEMIHGLHFRENLC